MRKLNDDRHYTAADGSEILCTDARFAVYPQREIFDDHSCDLGQRRYEIPEGILDSVKTGAIAPMTLKVQKNSRTGSVYIVKPNTTVRRKWRSPTNCFTCIETMLRYGTEYPEMALWMKNVGPR